MSDNKELISSLAETVEGNDYLLIQILVRVPLRDVITFKCVSKRWLSLISTHYFRRCHATVKQRVSGMFLDLAPDTVSYQEVKFFYLDEKTRRSSSSSSFSPKNPDLRSSLITQSCNGLMLLESEDAVFIYNPTTGDKKTLPPCFPLIDPLNLHYSLAFDPLRFLGYKVICIFDGVNSKNECFQTMIYSSESGVWKRGCSFPPNFHIDFYMATYFKDSIYWIGSKTTLRFDLKEECMKDDMPPLPPEPCHYEYVLAPACGYMNLAGFEFDEFSICVFRLKEDYCSPRWVHMHSVDLRPTLVQNYDRILCRSYFFSIGYRYNYSIVHLIEDNEDDMGLLMHIPGKVVVLRLKDRTYYYVSDLPIGNKRFSSVWGWSKIFPAVWGWYRAFEYSESLASV